MTDDPINRDGVRDGFWRRFTLDELTPREWEALCDGCGKCCLRKIEFEDTGEVEYTNVSCKLLDTGTCRCTNYKHRKRIVPDCVVISPEVLEHILYWMPSTCAYRLMAEGRPLEPWHPLVSGRAESVHEAGISLAGHMVSEDMVDEDDLEDYIVEGLQ
ncbi:YcgN family cysteine cluster protein [Halovulum sp. GXIMD14794]